MDELRYAGVELRIRRMHDELEAELAQTWRGRLSLLLYRRLTTAGRARRRSERGQL